MVQNLPPNGRHLRLQDQDIWLDPAGAVFVPSASLLVVSDLHFEKGSHYAMGGQFLPPYDTRSTLQTVSNLIDQYRPKRVLSLGDTFHDPQAEKRMSSLDRERLQALCSECEWIFVLGNHDPLPPKIFNGTATERITIAGLTFVHEPEGEGWHVAGHLHPCAVAVSEGRRIRRSCFVTDGQRLILPSMGRFTGGLNVLDPAFRAAFPEKFSVVIRGRSRLFQVPQSSLKPDLPQRRMPVLRRAIV